VTHVRPFLISFLILPQSLPAYYPIVSMRVFPFFPPFFSYTFSDTVTPPSKDVPFSLSSLTQLFFFRYFHGSRLAHPRAIIADVFPSYEIQFTFFAQFVMDIDGITFPFFFRELARFLRIIFLPCFFVPNSSLFKINFICFFVCWFLGGGRSLDSTHCFRRGVSSCHCDLRWSRAFPIS